MKIWRDKMTIIDYKNSALSAWNCAVDLVKNNPPTNPHDISNWNTILNYLSIRDSIEQNQKVI
jgi:hypothetical protein